MMFNLKFNFGRDKGPSRTPLHCRLDSALPPSVCSAMTAEELLPHPAYRCGELVGGALRVSEPPGWAHGRLAVLIARLLDSYVERHRLGAVVVEAGYLLSRNPDTVRGPDVSFVVAARVSPGQTKAFFAGAPDLAVEILSPFDSSSDVQEKVVDYLQAGARLVWLVDPESASITVHHPGQPPRVARGGDLLDGEDVVPGFQCQVSELFG